MDDLNTNKKMLPKKAVIIYQDTSTYSPKYYLESRDIINAGGKYSFGAAMPMATEIFKKIAHSYMKESAVKMNFSGYIPNHILYGSNESDNVVVMWYRPAMTRSLNFSASLRIKGSSTVKVPATLYLVINTKLYIYALQTNERPTAKTKLFNAPYFNVYQDGNVCLGSAQVGKVKGKTFDEEAERFERAFYMAEQNSPHNKSSKTELSKLWTTLIKNKEAFPAKTELIQHSSFKTLGDLIIKMVNKNFKTNG